MITQISSENLQAYKAWFEKASAALKASGLTQEDGITHKYGEDFEISSVSGYFQVIKDLAELNKIYLRLPVDEPIFEIDANTRKITAPSDFKLNGLGVAGDQLAEIVFFRINRFFDTADFADDEYQIYIQWKTSTDSGYSPCVIKDIESEPNYVIFGWPISKEITSSAGKISFSVRIVRIEGEEITYSFSTQTNNDISINAGLNYDLLNGEVSKVDYSSAIMRNVKNSQAYSLGVDAKPAFYIDLHNDDEEDIYVNLDLPEGSHEYRRLKVAVGPSDSTVFTGGYVTCDWYKDNTIVSSNNKQYIFEVLNADNIASAAYIPLITKYKRVDSFNKLAIVDDATLTSAKKVYSTIYVSDTIGSYIELGELTEKEYDAAKANYTTLYVDEVAVTNYESGKIYSYLANYKVYDEASYTSGMSYYYRSEYTVYTGEYDKDSEGNYYETESESSSNDSVSAEDFDNYLYVKYYYYDVNEPGTYTIKATITYNTSDSLSQSSSKNIIVIKPTAATINDTFGENNGQGFIINNPLTASAVGIKSLQLMRDNENKNVLDEDYNSDFEDNLSYAWYKKASADGIGSIISGETATTYTPSENGYYYFTVTSDRNNCKDVDKVTISSATAYRVTEKVQDCDVSNFLTYTTVDETTATPVLNSIYVSAYNATTIYNEIPSNGSITLKVRHAGEDFDYNEGDKIECKFYEKFTNSNTHIVQSTNLTSSSTYDSDGYFYFTIPYDSTKKGRYFVPTFECTYNAQKSDEISYTAKIDDVSSEYTIKFADATSN